MMNTTESDAKVDALEFSAYVPSAEELAASVEGITAPAATQDYVILSPLGRVLAEVTFPQDSRNCFFGERRMFEGGRWLERHDANGMACIRADIYAKG